MNFPGDHMAVASMIVITPKGVCMGRQTARDFMNHPACASILEKA